MDIVRIAAVIKFISCSYSFQEAKDLIKRLICDKEDRIGKQSINEIKDHPFFRNVDWNTIRYVYFPSFEHSLIVLSRDRPAAIRVEVRGLTDTSHFETSPIEENFPAVEGTEPDDRDWVFINYTYKRFEGLTQRAQRQNR